MDTIQRQITTLSTKIDTLFQLIEQLSHRMSEIVSECKLGQDSSYAPDMTAMLSHRSSYSYNRDSAMEHKDVLVDTDGLDLNSQGTERQLSPELQVQRLTAQLTAAYGRIAALEEQLLSLRIH